MRPVIFVLEDHEARVEFVRELFGAFADIEWHATVRGFLAAVEAVAHERVIAVIWDHDLGEVGHNRDADGLQGIDAARSVEIPRRVYQLVWSCNPVGAENIASELKRRGFVDVEEVPARTENRPKLAARLTTAYLAWKRGRS